MKIADLADRAAIEGGIDLPSQIRQIAMEYNLMSAYTAFIAVDSMTRTAGDHGVTIAVPVPVPEGVRYETTVQEAGSVQHAAQ
jgi:Ca-activated chloride channel family protein